eukprot:gb/GFBE01036135.1/.p1 GENE.gb/GFBE01036135.1/~~gb/GFBE01036135.1/.p1  ORF type:complete len:121 (+),score=17.64 gb/GFBE01036135.1/:1-363(+)
MGEISHEHFRGGTCKIVTHPELQYGPGISGGVPWQLAGHAQAKGTTMQHHELQYGPGVSGSLEVDHHFGGGGGPPAGGSQVATTGEAKEKPKKRVPGRGEVVKVEERILDGWQKRRDRIR